MLFPDVLGKEFNEIIENIRQTSIGTPKRLYIDLAVAHNNLCFNLTGNFFYVIESADPANNFDIRFNEVREPAFNLVRQMGFYTPYYQFFITNDAQPAGNVTIVYGTLARPFLDIIDNRSPVATGIDAVRDELRGDVAPEGYGVVAVGAAAGVAVAANVDRKSLIIQHELAVDGGVGIVYLGFSAAVTAANYFIALNPGDYWSIDDYRGDVYAIRSAGATNISYGEV